MELALNTGWHSFIKKLKLRNVSWFYKKLRKNIILNIKVFGYEYKFCSEVILNFLNWHFIK